MLDYKVIREKSTVPHGTAKQTQSVLSEILKKRAVNIPIKVVSNSEFLKEGAAINDFLKLGRTIIDRKRAHPLCDVRTYQSFNRNQIEPSSWT